MLKEMHNCDRKCDLINGIIPIYFLEMIQYKVWNT